MIGRNDPCLCGSGKKYKKCCALKETPTIAEVQTEELERVLQTFFNMYPEREDIKEYLTLTETWKDALNPYLMEEIIEAIVLDEFFFHHRLDIWEEHLERQKKRTIRPSVIQALEAWSEPRVFVGKVIEVIDDYMTVTNILKEETISIRRESDRPIPVGVHLYCFVLPDGTGKESHYLAISTLIFFPKDHDNVFIDFSEKLTSSDEKSVFEYMKTNGLLLWKMLCENGYRGDEFTEFEASILEVAVEFLDARARETDKFIEIIEDYLVELQPNARKDVAVAAGAIRFGQEHALFEPLGLTVKEIAELFDVSTSTLNKYYNDMNAYYRLLKS